MEKKKAGVSHSSMTSFKCFKQMLGNIFPFRNIIVLCVRSRGISGILFGFYLMI